MENVVKFLVKFWVAFGSHLDSFCVSVELGARPLGSSDKSDPKELERREPPLTLRRQKISTCILAAFPPVRRGLFPVVRDFLCIIPTEQVLYYRNLGLYYGLASGTLPLYSDPCLGVKGGCVPCERVHLSAWSMTLTCDWSRRIQESRGPLGPKSPKSLKMVFPGLPASSVSKKVSKKCQTTRKRVKKTTKSVFGDFFDTFLTLPTGRPGKSFLRLLGDSGVRGCGDSCIWGLHTQTLTPLRTSLVHPKSGSKVTKSDSKMGTLLSHSWVTFGSL